MCFGKMQTEVILQYNLFTLMKIIMLETICLPLPWYDRMLLNVSRA